MRIDINDVPGLEKDLIQVNKHIERLCQSDTPTMQKLMDWMLESRGKQIRPILTLLCARLTERKVDATETAAVIEICHTASLIHDDIIDEADVRRGRTSLQKQFGKEMAVYAGDFMIFSAIARTKLINKPWYRKMFAKLEIMCNGEVGQFDNQYNSSITEEMYLNNIIGKTSSMFEIACESGACEGKCSKSQQTAVGVFAKYFGLMFQIRDDLMDFISNTEKSTKTVHNDFWCGYYTLPAIHTFESSVYGIELKEIAAKLKDHPRSSELDDRIAWLITQADGYRYTYDKIMTYGELAKKQMDCFIDTAAKRKLIELVDMLMNSVSQMEIPGEDI